MMRMKRALWALVLPILLTSIPFVAPGQINLPKMKSTIRQIDHILIQAGDPKYLFDFFAETLQLPVAWPIADHAGFASGGVAAGNVNIEVLRFADPKRAASTNRSQARFIGFALEPFKLADCLVELQARDIRCNPPQPHVSKLPNGSEGTLWTNVVLPEFSKPNLSVFLCEYNSAFLHAEIRRNQLGGQLALKKGGPLGIKSVGEIVIGSRNLAKDRADWERLLMPPAHPATKPLKAGNGPAVRLVSDSTDRIQRIVLMVDSLKSARNFLAQKHLLGAASANEISIASSGIQGLSIHLAEK
jgi:hypothetical protein